jgi:hypothetical protein
VSANEADEIMPDQQVPLTAARSNVQAPEEALSREIRRRREAASIIRAISCTRPSMRRIRRR